MEQLVETLSQRATEAVLLGLKAVTHSPRVKCIKNIPYGESSRHVLDLYLPQDQKPKYLVMFIHGGFWQMGNKDQYTFMGNALAKKGIASMVINYRLFPETTYPGFIDDAAKVLSWLEASGNYYGLDDTPLFLMGHSAGVHIALLSVLDPQFAERHRFNPANVKGVICLAGVYSFRPEKNETYREMFPLPESGENYSKTKPVNFATENGIPLYILHGRNDKTVACRSAERMYKNAILANHPVFLDVRENYGHSELLFEFVDYWPNHKKHMKKLEQFMQDCCE